MGVRMKRSENYCAVASTSLLEVSTLAAASEVMVEARGRATGTAAAATDAAAAEADEVVAATDAAAALALAVVARAALSADVALCWELVLPFLRAAFASILAVSFSRASRSAGVSGAIIVFRRGRLGSGV